jgi:hypothetical protein
LGLLEMPEEKSGTLKKQKRGTGRLGEMPPPYNLEIFLVAPLFSFFDNRNPSKIKLHF